MLISFKVTNFRSISEPLKIDFSLSTKLKKNDLPQNYSNENKNHLLTCLIMYGRNAAGKSNVLSALNKLQIMVVNSANLKHNEKIFEYEPFVFEKNKEFAPIEFEIVFLSKNNLKFNYCIKYLSDKIVYESLYFFPKDVAAKLFERNDDKFTYGEYFKGDKKNIEEYILPNQLFLSKSASSNIEHLKDAYVFLTDIIYSDNSSIVDGLLSGTISEQLLENKLLKKNLINLLKQADTNIGNLNINQMSTENLDLITDISPRLKDLYLKQYRYRIASEHPFFNNGKLEGIRDIDFKDESFGTQKLLIVSTLILNAIFSGGIIVIDELDKSLHPQLTKMLIKLFHSKKNNPNNAQLIFSTHDSSLLDLDLFRRDQILFVDKTYEGNTFAYKLSDFKKTRNNIPLDKWYLSGRFDAVPVLTDFEVDFENVKL